MTNSFTQTEQNENFAADAAQWEAESAMAAMDAEEARAWAMDGAGMDESDADEPRGWPGDGSGADDLADFNAMEAEDYRDE